MDCVYCGESIDDDTKILDPGLCWPCTCAVIVLSESPELLLAQPDLRATYIGLVAESTRYAHRLMPGVAGREMKH